MAGQVDTACFRNPPSFFDYSAFFVGRRSEAAVCTAFTSFLGLARLVELIRLISFRGVIRLFELIRLICLTSFVRLEDDRLSYSYYSELVYIVCEKYYKGEKHERENN